MYKYAVRGVPGITRAPAGTLSAGVLALWLLCLSLFGGRPTLEWSLDNLWTLGIVAAGIALLYLVPGLVVLRVLWRDNVLVWPVRAGLALGIGVALPPLLLEAASLVGLPWQRWTTLVFVLLAAGLLAGFHLRSPLPAARRDETRTADGLLLAGITVVALLARLYVVRDLPVGMWGDSYHHTMMAQLLVDNHGLFTSWEPYAPLATFTYHFGFHANAAFFHWLTGTPVTQSVLQVGQILNVLTIPVAYAFGTRLARSSSAGLWAALLTGFVNTQPAFYVNWGRYTQLAGHVLLPALLICWMAAIEARRLEWRRLALAALVTASLFLTHYIVSIFAALFLIVYLAAVALQKPVAERVRSIVVRSAILTTGAVLLAAPWLMHTLSGHLGRNTASFVNGGVAAERVASYAALPPVAPLYLKSTIVALAVAGLLIAVAARQWRMVLPAVWAQMLFLAVVPHVVGLPGAGIVDNLTGYLALYLPVTALAGYALAAGQAALSRRHAGAALLLSGSAALLVSVWGTGWQQRLLAERYQLFTAADAQAMEWIKGNTPSDSRFLVNTFPAYGGSVLGGSDGGWWLPLLTGRWSNLPPITYGSERAAEADYAERVNHFAEILRGRPLTDAAPVKVDLTSETAIEALRDARIHYVYSGAHPAPGPETGDRIDTTSLAASPMFRQIYTRDGVEIWEFTGGE